MRCRLPRASAWSSAGGCLVAVVLSSCTLPELAPSADVPPGQRWHAAAAAGDAEAQFRLGRALCCGSPRHRDFAAAAAWLCRAASGGHREAMVLLAELYAGRAGEPVPPAQRDFSRAYAWYTVASGQGDPNALAARNELGNMLEREEVMAGKRFATRWRNAQCPPTD